ncbi:hypothetical protein GUJ93_ZPchr0003g18084 [Zizania palustris]|uniref:Uncharacterized protein n=1 Tax=Zizania palustris TaxID=103762 RepID=A0A8J5SVT9_ZIZPA|nr:hypothetical protein GUJ93_ZPchr0003g18084 [Zizania palustris]KAG8062661.1 hypothetical protein GUJ93_ZPchr0003g18084 [Zizania palustris]KAG8062662.1 hypothetical protein GUJ93_ZPchr0003g18084 [Zizania palustris]
MVAAVATVASSPSPSPASSGRARGGQRHPLSFCSAAAAPSLLHLTRSSGRLRRGLLRVAAKETDVLPGPGVEGEMVAAGRLEEQPEGPLGGSQLDIGGLAFQGDMGGGFAGGSTGSGETGAGGGDGNKMLDRSINTVIVLGASTYALTKLLTVDHDYWHGWTIFEILRYMPEHNWSAYEEALKTNPVLAKMMISGIVYSLGDWIAQVCNPSMGMAVLVHAVPIAYNLLAISNFVDVDACSATKASQSLSSTVLGCSGPAS